MKEIKAGIVGLGKMGLLHSAILNSLNNVRVVAVTDTEKLVRNLFQTVMDIKTYNDFKKMIEDNNLDVIYITTPVNSHISIASYCANNKLNFFIEKPVGRNSEECESLCKIVRENDILSMVGFYLRYADTFSKGKELLDQKFLGEIKSIKSSVYQSQILNNPSGWRFNKKQSGGGVLIDLGTHLIDLLLWYFGKIKSVSGIIESNYSLKVESTVNSSILFENGLKGMLDASWNLKGYRLQETTIEIEGTLANMKINEDFIKIRRKSSGDEDQDVIIYKQDLYRGVPIDIGGIEYTRENEDFMINLRNQKQSMLNLVDSCQIQNVVDSIYKSAKNKKMEKVIYFE